MQRAILAVVALVVIGAAAAWVLSAPKPRYAAAAWTSVGARRRRSRTTSVLRRGLRILPCNSGPERSFEARRRA